MIDVTDNTFKNEVLDFDGTVFVDFWASWCGPCKAMMPVYERLASEFESNRVKFVKYEAGAEDCSAVLREYNISGLPTFITFHEGQFVRKSVGAGVLEDFVKETLENTFV